MRDSLLTEEEDRKLEVATVKQVLRTCSYLEWLLNKVQDNIRRKEELKEERKGKKVKKERNRGMVVVPYVQGLTEKVSKVSVQEEKSNRSS